MDMGVSLALPPTVSQLKKRKKSPKGTVSVQVFKGRLRLCWSFQRQRYFLYLELPEGKTNRIVAEGKAKQIEGDMATGNFDRTLAKYKPQQRVSSSLKAVDLFEKFMQHKAKRVYKRTLEKYRALLGYINQFFRGKVANNLSESDAGQFKEWLAERLAPVTVRERIELMRACWIWGAKQGLTDVNPWVDVLKTVRVPPQQKPKPFTKEEMGKILAGFKADCHYAYYLDYVEFLLSTGCRTGEAIGLRWAHLNHDCSVMWIGESVSRGQRKEVKTNRARFVSLTPRLQSMLSARKPLDVKPDDLVFPSPKGRAIDDHNFRNRAWKKVLSAMNVEYRKPYTTRSTLISHALDMGNNPVMVAEMTGHDVKTLYRNYAGNVQSRPRLPELFDA